MTEADEFSVVPEEFRATAHPVFRNFSPPVFTESPPASPAIEVDRPSTVTIAVDPSCPVCLSHMHEPVTIVRCHHSFCKACIERWLEVSASCPMCKEPVHHYLSARPQDDATHYLYSRPQKTDDDARTSQAELPDGLGEAVRVQRELHEKLALLDNDDSDEEIRTQPKAKRRRRDHRDTSARGAGLAHREDDALEEQHMTAKKEGGVGREAPPLASAID